MNLLNYLWQAHITAPPAPFVMTGLPKNICRVAYYVELETPALAGLITVVVRWKGRDGDQRSHTSTGLSLLAGQVVQGSVNIWMQDDYDAELEIELVANSVVGSYQLSWWATLEAMETY